MLEIEILESHDTDSIGSYNFIYPNVTIGTNVSSNLRVLDSAASEQILLKIAGENRLLIIYGQDTGFICNSNRFFLSTVAKTGDIIEFNSLKLRIVSISTDGHFPIDIKSYRDKLLKEITEKYPEKLQLLEAIEDDLLTLGLP